MRDPWAVLGLTQSASADEIKSAYRRLAKDHHPDRGGDPDLFIEIQKAYQQLTNPQNTQQSAHPYPHGFESFEQIFRNFGFDFGNRAPVQNANFEAFIEVSVADSIQGCTKTIQVEENGNTRWVNVTVPQGCYTGDTIKYSGQGSTAHSQLPPGDLYVRVLVQPYDDFEYRQGDLLAEKSITVWQALLGCHITVTDPLGHKIQISVPAGCPPGTTLRVAQCGGFRRDIQQRGDILIKLKVQMVKLTDQQREIIQQWT